MFDFIRANAGSSLSKVIFGIIILVFVFWGVGNFSATGRHSVATVNGENITVGDFVKAVNAALKNNDEYRRVSQENEVFFKEFKYQLLNGMIRNKIMEEEARSLGLFIAPQELRFELSSIGLFQNDKGNFDPKLYEEVLKSQKLLPGKFEQGFISDMLIAKLQNYIALSVTVSPEEARNFFDFIREERIADYLLFPLANYMDKAKPSDEEISAFYDANKGDFSLPARGDYDYIKITPYYLSGNYEISEEEMAAYYENEKAQFTSPQRYLVNRIVLDKDGNKEDLNKKVEEIKGKLADGAKIADLVNEYSAAEDERENAGSMGWIAAHELSADILENLEKTEMNSFTEPVEMSNYYQLLYLSEKKAESTLELAEVKDIIKSTLAEEKANLDFNNLYEKAEDELRRGLDFAEIAKGLKLEVKNTGLKPSLEAIREIGLTEKSLESIGYLPAGKAVPTPLEIENGVVLLFVKDSKAEEIPPLADLKDEISEKLSRIKAEELAREDAAKTLADISDSGAKLAESYAGKVKLSEKITRTAVELKPLGKPTELIEALFIANKDEWLKKAYTVDKGVVIARVKSVIPAPQAEWDAMPGFYQKNLLDNKRNIAIATYIDYIGQRADIKYNYEVVDSLPFR